MPLALLVARLILAPALLAIGAWFVALRRARPDLVTPWLTLKVVLLCASVALAAFASAIGSPVVALVCIGVADVVAWAVTARLWIERRPRALSEEETSREAARLAHAGLDLVEREEARRRDK